MLASETATLQQVITLINNSIAANDMPNVQIVQVNVQLQDGKYVTLHWNAQAIDNGDGTFTGDWEVTAS